MATFKIRDLVVSLEPGWCGATPERPHPEVPSAGPGHDDGGAPQVESCKASSPGCRVVNPPICVASHLVMDIDCVSPNELAVLKSQLTAALKVVARREEELGKGAAEPTNPAEIEALEAKLSEALQELRSKKAASRSKR